MGIFDMFKQTDIHRGVEEYRRTTGAVLLDVRTPQEYLGGHIPGSQNIPLQDLERADEEISSKNVPLFVYCYSGGRSRQAVAMLQRMGYAHVKNVGGIASYIGEIER